MVLAKLSSHKNVGLVKAKSDKVDYLELVKGVLDKIVQFVIGKMVLF